MNPEHVCKLWTHDENMLDRELEIRVLVSRNIDVPTYNGSEG